MNSEAIRAFAVSKIGWIRQQQRKQRDQEREAPREYLNRESHFVWGRRYLLEVIARNDPSSIELGHSVMHMQIRPGASEEKKEELLDDYYHALIRKMASQLIAKWEPQVGVKVDRIFVQRMKTRWGSSNYKARSIRLNSELAKKSPECLEYIVVHELVHLIEPTNNHRFVGEMDRLMPQWRHFRDVLNQLPVRHEDWHY
jgi:predicted metal-dependent hydrolase